jgi:hypothetical protein
VPINFARLVVHFGVNRTGIAESDFDEGVSLWYFYQTVSVRREIVCLVLPAWGKRGVKIAKPAMIIHRYQRITHQNLNTMPGWRNR